MKLQLFDARSCLLDMATQAVDRLKSPAVLVEALFVTVLQIPSPEDRPLPEGELLRIAPWSKRSLLVCVGWFLLLAGFSAGSAAGEGNVVSGIIALIIGAIGFTNLGVPRAGLIVHQHGIVLRELQWGGWIKTREWTWPEVDRFEVKRPRLKWALRIHLADGSIVSAPLLENKSVRNGPVAKAWVAELNRRAAAARAATD